MDEQAKENQSNLSKSDNTNSDSRNKGFNKFLNNSITSYDNENDKDINAKREKNSLKEENKVTIKSLDAYSYNKEAHQKVNLFFKGKELINDEEILGNLVSNNGSEELELSVFILSLNDSTFIDENKTKEKLFNKISNKCPYHTNNKELFICTSCNVAFCKYCSDKHKSHNIIEKKDIIKFNNELKSLNNELNKKLTEAKLTNIYESNENENTIYNDIEKLQNRLDNIKKIHRRIINDYKREIDKSLPYLLEYKEKVGQLIENSYNLDTIKDDQQFIDYYFWYINIKQKQEKIEKEIYELEKVKKNFEEMMKNFDEKLKNIYTNSNDDYKLLKQIYYKKNTELENQFKSIPSSSNESQVPKLNLFNLFNKANNAGENLFPLNDINMPNKNIKDLSEIISINENDKENELLKQKTPITSRIKERKNNLEFKNLSKSYRNNLFSSRKKKNSNFHFEKIEEKSEKEESIDDLSSRSHHNIKKIYNINPNTQTIFYLDMKAKKIEEKKVNFENLSFEYFEENQATLNYRNNFFISGGTNLQIFYKYDFLLNKFIKLSEMPTPHSCHNMLGVGNYIFVISGNLSKKVEKYNIIKNNWESLNELNEIRIWPGCFTVNNEFLFVFGGLKDKVENKNIELEKIDFSSLENKWEKLSIAYKYDFVFPYNYGFIQLKENQFFIIGGKYNYEIEEKNKITNSYKISINDKGVEIEKDEDWELPKNDEFNGKMFNYLGDGLYGAFSSKFHRKFYLINMFSKSFEEIN